MNKRYEHILYERNEAIKDKHTMKNLEDLESVAEELNRLSQKIKELEIRNNRQYQRLKEITDLMVERDWKSLEKMVEEWEQAEERLKREWGTYGGLE